MTRLLFAAIAVCAFTSVGCRHHNLAKNGCDGCDKASKVAECSNCGTVQQASYSGSAGCSTCGNGHSGDPGTGGYAWGGHGVGLGGLGNPQAVPRIPHGQYPGNIGPAGPSSAAVGYPYYTTRGPRDFLMDKPPTIGN
jgi:hypothetical protein